MKHQRFKRKIAVITGTRAEYGLLYWIMKRIERSKNLELQLIVAASHLDKKFGYTISSILADGFSVSARVKMELCSDSAQSIANSMGEGLRGFAKCYQRLRPDIILVLGDRYEILAAVSAAIPFNIPVAHLCGGEMTEGITDELIRHAVTKMAHLHFPSAEPYADNVERMGEERWRVIRCGHPGIENIKRLKKISKKALFNELELDLRKETFLVTLHTTTTNSAEKEKMESAIFFDCLKKVSKDRNIVITYPNNDHNHEIILKNIDSFRKNENVKVFRNLGNLRFINLMRHCQLILGNSSSSLVEAPFLRVPVIDYADRQKGRLLADNIIHVDADKKKLLAAIKVATTDKAFLQKVKRTKCIYGEGDTSGIVVKTLEKVEIDRRLLRKKLLFARSGKSKY